MMHCGTSTALESEGENGTISFDIFISFELLMFGLRHILILRPNNVVSLFDPIFLGKEAFTLLQIMGLRNLVFFLELVAIFLHLVF